MNQVHNSLPKKHSPLLWIGVLIIILAVLYVVFFNKMEKPDQQAANQTDQEKLIEQLNQYSKDHPPLTEAEQQALIDQFSKEKVTALTPEEKAKIISQLRVQQ